MKRDQFWKNFELCTELNISGRFIYNGLHTFHEMQHFAYEEEIFEFLYNISVGIERLLKIAVILIEHNETVDQNNFKKNLITHNHVELLRRVKNAHKLNFSNTHNDFLELLRKFYKASRYGRYNLDAMTTEQTEFINFLNKGLSISIEINDFVTQTQNHIRIKKYLGKIVGKIASDLYEIIGQEARRLNIYTYEVRYGSKAFKIFAAKEYDFEKEDILRRELLVYFVNSNDDGDHSRFIRSLTPLSFDPGNEADYISCFDSNVKTISILDELKQLYEDEVKDVKGRKGALEAIGSAHLYYDPNEVDDEEDEDED